MVTVLAFVISVRAQVVIGLQKCMKYSGTCAVPKIDFGGCTDCVIAYGLRTESPRGVVEDIPAISRREGSATLGTHVKIDGTARVFVPLVPDPWRVRRSCIYGLHVCADERPETCRALDAGLYYEYDNWGGAAKTTIPLGDGLSLPIRSDEFEARLCADQVS